MLAYRAIGLMSGSSLDGLDIAFVRLQEEVGTWRYEWIATDCIPYADEWLERLKAAQSLSVPQFLELHTAYGHYIGQCVNTFLNSINCKVKPDFIVSHGHTVYHNPAQKTTAQIGDGAAIAAITGIPAITDLRNMDVALGGQGAPIVPIGDRLLFGEYDALLNLGGIANISLRNADGTYTAFDICPCNQLLDYYAQKAGKKFDSGGTLAKAGIIHEPMLARLSEELFYRKAPPKSLANEFSQNLILPLLEAANLTPQDALATCTAHIAHQIGESIRHASPGKMLVTGGGAFNTFLIESLQGRKAANSLEIIIPEPQLIAYKEALIMALIGALRIRSETNVYASVTGASRDSIGGAIWAGA